MSMVEKLIDDFQKLPNYKKQEVLEFVEFLKTKNQKNLEDLMDNIIKDNSEALRELSK